MKKILNLCTISENTNSTINKLEKHLKDENFKAASKTALELDGRGVVDGTYALSIMYHNGDGVKQDYKKEVELLWRASLRKHNPSIYNLSLALVAGKGVKPDAKLALYLMESLAEDDYEPALEMLMEVA